ncbi:uncharacterized protein DSM5745_09344 [Aspergillus mulundensis]|uniref:Uncharacterized protein n=1 Tax=Aspergillus mulundensis TaxID=1810919 RepID=A0A3D8R0J9_9EURO|nr:hypothetical protein DSM5745_09344 [Aspergillus mulundensis]RDW67478.1 hypothetical protein DSM5745_09344 [Aspergillus mulundensis]
MFVPPTVESEFATDPPVICYSYNSATYFAMGPSDYRIVLVSVNGTLQIDRTPSSDAADQACSRAPFDMDLSNFTISSWEGRLQNLSKEECLDQFAQNYVYGHKFLFLATNATLPDDQLFPMTNACSTPSETECSEDHVKDNLESWLLLGDALSIPVLQLSIPDMEYSGGTFTTESLGVRNSRYLPDYQRLYDILRYDRPEERALRADLDNATLWENSSWAKDVEILGGHTQWCREPVDELYFPIQYCLSLPDEQRCQLGFTPPTCLIVITCNIIKLVCMFLARRDDRDDPLLTVGDAISSFLTRPDPTTKDAGLLSVTRIRNNAFDWHESYVQCCYCHLCEMRKQSHQQNKQLPKPGRWSDAPSKHLWTNMLLVSAILLGTTGGMLALGVVSIHQYYSTTSIWDYGLGEVNPATLITGLGLEDEGAMIAIILLSNTPQLLISLTYFMYNNILSSMLLAAEYDDYAAERKPLRVSWPRGAQRSTYYLSLPYRYSVPLQVSSALLHWLVSQSLFFVRIVSYNSRGEPYSSEDTITCGYSPQAIIYAMILGGVLVGAALVLGLRRFKSRMLLAAYCSAAISAACHPCVEGDHALRPVQWGEIVVDSSPPQHEDEQASASERERSEGDPLTGEEGDTVATDSGSYPANENERGSASEVDSGDSDPLTGEAGDTPTNQNGSDSDSGNIRYFHCSFTSAEVVVPDASRQYI